MLNRIEHGDGNGPPLLIAHGLYGSARNWGIIAKRLSDHRRVVAVDMRNHGHSQHAPDHSYPALANDLAETIRDLGGQADVLGHSMGGKAAMVLALMHPELVRSLVVADIAPVRYAHTQIEFIDAMEAVDLTQVTRRSEADVQMRDTVRDPALRAFLLQSLEIADGRASWRLNLTALRDQMPLIMAFPAGFEASPRQVHVLRGGQSHYVQGDHETAMRELFPHARIETLSGAGHWLHAEDPRGFEAMLRAALPT